MSTSIYTGEKSTPVTYSATAPNGFISTRTSGTMTYTHAVLDAADGGALTWHQTEAAARKAATAKGQNNTVVPVKIERKGYKKPAQAPVLTQEELNEVADKAAARKALQADLVVAQADAVEKVQAERAAKAVKPAKVEKVAPAAEALDALTAASNTRRAKEIEVSAARTAQAEAIRAAFAAGHGVTAIAAATGLSKVRAYRIRDEK